MIGESAVLPDEIEHSEFCEESIYVFNCFFCKMYVYGYGIVKSD